MVYDKNMAKKKTIRVNAVNDASKYLIDNLKPGLHHMPEWYRKQKNYSDGANTAVFTDSADSIVATYKICVPFIDTLTSGYILSTPADIYVKKADATIPIPYFGWKVDWPLLDFQDPKVLGNYPTPYAHNPNLFRWYVDWQIVTPKGYSLWVTHPSHRYDLPFTTLNGFVDTDTHPNHLLLPFFIREGFEGIIPKGTPIAQLFPIKRENWELQKGVVKEGYDFVNKNIMKTYAFRTYKRLFWNKKSYK
jgi:hypothetical protein